MAGNISSEKIDLLIYGPMRPILESGFPDQFVVHSAETRADLERLTADTIGKLRGMAVTYHTVAANREQLARFPKLEIIASFGVGYDHVDAAYAREHNIMVTNTPDVLTEEVADVAMGLLIATLREFVKADRYVRSGLWQTQNYPLSVGSMRDRKIGIVGMGRIGQAVARRARAFGLQIHYHNRRPVAPQIAEELGATYWESLDQMLARMDIISVNCPHTPATFHLLSARRLKLIRKEAYIVNTARGEVIDEDTLVKLIEAGEIGGAGLDVYENEPAVSPKLVRLAKAGKVTLLPHMGSATIEGRVEMGEKVIINIRTFLDAHKPPDRVLPSML